MQISAALGLTAQKAARSALIFGIIFYDSAVHHCLTNRIIRNILFSHFLVGVNSQTQLIPGSLLPKLLSDDFQIRYIYL